jgi:hypothetical protein
VVTGRRIRYLPVSTERDAALLSTQDVPEEVVARLTRVLTELLDGRNARLTPGVERVIDPESRDLVGYVRPRVDRGLLPRSEADCVPRGMRDPPRGSSFIAMRAARRDT